MRNAFSIIIFLFALFISSICAAQDPYFVFIVPSYNNEQWVQKNLQSIAEQSYTQWSMIYIDDCSKDNTGDLVDAFIKTHNLQHKCTLIRNTKRIGALANIYNGVHMVDPQHIIVIVDGDDRLANKEVLAKVARVYKNKDVWLTYGDFKSDPPGWSSCCERIPKSVRKQNSFRKYKWVASHLRTFYAKLFHNIKKEDLMLNGEFFPMTYDMAITFPMLEMASKDHFEFIKDVLYIYNVSNPIMDWRTNAELQRELDRHIRGLRPYAPLKTLF